MALSFKITDYTKLWGNSRSRKVPCTTIVLHATAGGSLNGALVTLGIRKLSYHYIIDKDGSITKCCPISKVAYHAGKSFGPNGSNVNDYSIGISFVNRNNGKDDYTPEQVKACVELIKMLKPSLPNLKWLTTHYWISPKRKTDPVGLDVNSINKNIKAVVWRSI